MINLMNMQVMSIPLKKHINMRVSAKNKEVPQVTMVLNLHVTKITHPNWFRSRGGWILHFFKCMEIRGG